MLVTTSLIAPVVSEKKYCRRPVFREKSVVKIHKVKNIDRIILALVFSAQVRVNECVVANTNR